MWGWILYDISIVLAFVYFVIFLFLQHLNNIKNKLRIMTTHSDYLLRTSNKKSTVCQWLWCQPLIMDYRRGGQVRVGGSWCEVVVVVGRGLSFIWYHCACCWSDAMLCACTPMMGKIKNRRSLGLTLPEKLHYETRGKSSWVRNWEKKLACCVTRIYTVAF